MFPNSIADVFAFTNVKALRKDAVTQDINARLTNW
jgi:hypothetical protein